MDSGNSENLFLDKARYLQHNVKEFRPDSKK